jgi:hypothetical protein
VRSGLDPVLWWVRLYTRGLPRQIRDERRAEIESDLWEQSRDAEVAGSDGVRLFFSVWTRCLLGVVHDLAWRAEQRDALRRPSPDRAGPFGPRPGDSRRRLLGLLAGVTLALALVSVLVIANTIEYSEGTQPVGVIAAALLTIITASAAVGIIVAARGFWVMRRRPVVGALLVVAGSSVAGLTWYWLLVPVLMSVAVSVYGVARAVRLIDAGRFA